LHKEETMRKNKRMCNVVTELSSSEEEEKSASESASTTTATQFDTTTAMAVIHNKVLKRKTSGPRNRVQKKMRIGTSSIDRIAGASVVTSTTEEQYKMHIPFCCSNCTCSDLVKKRIEKFHGGDEVGKVCYWMEPDQEGNLLHHLRCCHGIVQKVNESKEDFNSREFEWAPAYLSKVAEAATMMENDDGVTGVSQCEWIDRNVVKKATSSAKAIESKYHNESVKKIHEFYRLNVTHSPSYQNCVMQPFQDQVKQIAGGEKMRGLVVLDCFAGVGTGTTALKRLCINISKIIYIDHDKVAKHVYRTNHDIDYFNADVEDQGHHDPDEIKHVYDYSMWEELVGDHGGNEEKLIASVKTFLNKHGPIDLIIGGPPCIDYSKVNANREGARGKQGNYLVEMGKFIRILERLQGQQPVYFLVENVVLAGEDLRTVNEAFGMDIDPINIDAKDFSPCRRNRHFWTNIPLENFDYADAAPIGPASCLEEGYRLPANLGDPFYCRNGGNDQQTVAKANCFMGSSSRIDDVHSLRMYVFKEKSHNGKCWLGRPINTGERELMMGFPKGYIEEPVRNLFCILRDDALCHQYEERNSITGGKVGTFQCHWRDKLDPKYHEFAGNYHKLPCSEPHRFEVNTEFPYVGLKLSPAVNILDVGENFITTTNPYFFNAENYAKHLIGLAYSVPVVEHLLKPIQKMFSRKDYPRFSYKYAWKEQK